MFTFEFVTGAILLNAYFYVTLLLLVVLAISVIVDIKNGKSAVSYKNLAFIAIITTLGFLLMSGTSRPKQEINLPPNKAQIEYNKPKDVTVTTPEPRYEVLQGFEPLKKGD